MGLCPGVLLHFEPHPYLAQSAFMHPVSIVNRSQGHLRQQMHAGIDKVRRVATVAFQTLRRFPTETSCRLAQLRRCCLWSHKRT